MRAGSLNNASAKRSFFFYQILSKCHSHRHSLRYSSRYNFFNIKAIWLNITCLMSLVFCQSTQSCCPLHLFQTSIFRRMLLSPISVAGKARQSSSLSTLLFVYAKDRPLKTQNPVILLVSSLMSFTNLFLCSSGDQNKV